MLLLVFGVSAVPWLLTGGQAAELYTAVAFLLLPYSLPRRGSGREIVAHHVSAMAIRARAGLAVPGTRFGVPPPP
ncbi:hypothetical protein ACWFMI_05345 [Nocardiopsis terrae]